MNRKILQIFVIHNISIFLFLLIDNDLSILDLLCFELAIYIVFIKDSVKSYWYYLFCILVPVVFVLSTHLTIFYNWNKNYSELTSFSGETFYPKDEEFCGDDDRNLTIKRRKSRNTEYGNNSNKCKPTMRFLYVQSENQKLRFSCDKTISYGCDEINEYFNKSKRLHLINKDVLLNNEKIYVKYAEQSKYLTRIPFVTIKSFTLSPEILSPKQLVIYEISHQDKVIYDYDYFIKKYKWQRTKYILYTIYLVLNSIVFIFVYRSVFQKLSVHR